MTFELTIIGSGSAVPAYGRYHTSQALTINNNSFLIDCGEGTQQRLAGSGIKRERIKAIFISHLHGDHYLGLMGLLSSMHLLGRRKSLALIGPPGLKEILTIQLKYGSTHLNYQLDFHEVSTPGELVYEDRQVQVRSLPLQHRIPCFGYHFEERPKPIRFNKARMKPGMPLQHIAMLKQGKDVVDDQGNILHRFKDITLPSRRRRTYAFCSDTRYSEALIPLIRNVHLLYHESSFLETDASIADKTFHSTAAQAAKVASKANVEHLVLGHYSARYREVDGFLEEARRIFPNTSLGSEGATFSVED